MKDGKTSLDFFAVDFNEDFTAFHGQTLLDQAEYLNDAVAYILSLYHDSRRSQRDFNLPDPSSVVLIGHSMGGVVARTMLTMPNYQSNSVNTIVTMSAPHARPPVSFDADIVRAYKETNRYWRQAYSQKWANDNPLWHVTLISIAGGGLDNIIPSDYASLASLVPPTHGFTVFTSSIPNMWTGADHIQTTWCVQLMRATVRSIFETIDVHRSSQTKPRAERMRVFKKWFLTGMEPVAEKTLSQEAFTTLVTLEDNSNSTIAHGEKLVLRKARHVGNPKAHLLPIPGHSKHSPDKFTLLSSGPINDPTNHDYFEVLFCRTFPLHSGQLTTSFPINIDLSSGTYSSTRLACKTSASDVILLPASTRTSVHPYDKSSPFSYLEYSLDDLTEYQYVAIIDKSSELSQKWVVAEFSDNKRSVMQTNLGLRRLLALGLRIRLPANRPMVTDVSIPAVYSSLLAFGLRLGKQACGDDAELFTPLLRQYISEPYESKYFVNVKQANITLHGISPFMPPPLRDQAASNGVSLQFWTDPTCNSSIDVSLTVDASGSMGKLVMRYRMVFAAFPLLIVALVLRKQFQIYDKSGKSSGSQTVRTMLIDLGVFVPFMGSMDICLKSSLPLLVLALTFLAISLAMSSSTPAKSSSLGLFHWRGNSTDSSIDFTRNDLLLGSPDPFFWFLVPLCVLVSAGFCVIVNYVALGVMWVFCIPYDLLTMRHAWAKHEDGRSVPSAQHSHYLLINIYRKSIVPGFIAGSTRRRIITTCVLLFMVTTFIPYQFAFLDACIVQLITCTRALRLARETVSFIFLQSLS